MFKKILIVGCGLIGSSILRATIKKKISKKIFILEKSKKHINQIKKNYKKIQKDMMKNKLPTNKEFIEELTKAIDDYK